MDHPGPKRSLSLEVPSILAIAIATLVLCWPILSNEALHHGSDVSFHVTWARGFIESLHDGNQYPRWDATINRALGGPVFVFYPPLGFYLIALVNVAMRDLMASFRIVFLLAGFFAGFSFFRFAKHFASTFWATLGAITYVLLPYHALDLYDRFAFAEYLAFCWIPVLFIAIRRLATERSPNAWPLLVVSLAGLLFTHILTAFMALFVAGPYGIALLARDRNWRALLPLTAAGLLGAACAGIYVIPAIAEHDLVHIDWTTEREWKWDRHLLFHRPTGPGEKPVMIRPLVEKVATRQIEVMLVAAALLAGARWRHKSMSGTFEASLFFGLAAWTVFIQTLPASPLWEHLPGLETIQFPWRFLVFNSFATSALVAFLGPSSGPSARKVSAPRTRQLIEKLTKPAVIAAVAILTLIPSIAYTIELHSIRPFTYSESRSRMPLYESRIVREYIPSTVPSWETVNPLAPPIDRARLSPPGVAKVIEWRPERRVVEVESPTLSTLTLWTFDYPGWHATVDGSPVDIRQSSFLAMIEIPVPAGRHRVDVAFESTKDRVTGAVTSIVALLLFVTLAFKTRVRVGRGGDLHNDELPKKSRK